MSDYEYVRKTYNVPAYAGVAVESAWSDKRIKGVIVPKHDDNYVHVKFEDRKHAVPVHPQELIYHTEPSQPKEGM